MKKFDEFLNEGFRDKMRDMSLNDMMNHRPSYQDKVASSLIQIITSERKISEKSFTEYDKVIQEVDDFYDSNKSALDILIREFDTKKDRPSYCAETIFSQYFK